MAGNRLNHDGRNFYNSLYIMPAVFAFVLLILFFIYDQSAYSFRENGITADVIILSSFILSASVGYIYYRKRRLNAELIVILLFACGFALRLGYALRYGYAVNQHDVESLRTSGHLSYIYGIAESFSLPDTNYWQFSHPPLHHIIAAGVVKLSELCGFSLDRAFENIQLLTVFYASMTMLAGYSICRICRIRGNTLCFCAMLLAFHPSFFILAGSINNDILMILLSMYAVVFLMKWYGAPSIKYAFICGLFCGLAMCTKVSAALIAVVAAITVVIKYIGDRHSGNNSLPLGKAALQTLCFLAVLLPLGLWHPIRNYILFEQPLGYVAPIPVTSGLYTGDVSFVKRLILPFSTENFGIYVDVWKEYNVWHYLLRNSLFGEYNFGKEGIAVFAVAANFVLITASIAALVHILVRRSFKTERLMPLIVMYFVQLAFFIYFNIRYPFGCTMDFRYIVPLLFCKTAFLGVEDVRLKGTAPVLNIAVYAVKFAVVILSVTSVLLFI